MRSTLEATTTIACCALAVLLWEAPALASASASDSLVWLTLAKKQKRKPKPAAPQPQADEKSAQGTSTEGAGEGTGSEVARGPRGPTRIDFDDRLIQGQTNKSGAVYLFDRKELSVRSMVKQRTSFRDQIVRDVLAE